MKKSLFRSSLVLVAVLLLAGTFLWAELRLERPVAPARVAAAPEAEEFSMPVLWGDEEIAFSEEDGSGVPKPVRIVAKVLGLSDNQVADLLQNLSDIRGINESRRANNEAIRDEANSNSPDAEVIGTLVLANHGLGMEIGEIRREFIESLDEDQRKKLGVVRRASQLQPVLPAFRALGLLPHHR